MEKRNIVVVSNVLEEGACAFEFDFYFQDDMELFKKSVCKNIDPSLIKVNDQHHYVVIKLTKEVKEEVLANWKQFCTDNNVHVEEL